MVLFTFFVAFLFFVGWSLLQTERFAYIVSSHITKQISKKFNLDFKFQKIEIKLFPPATIFYNTKIFDKGQAEKLSLEASSLGIYYGILDILYNKVTLDNILLKEGMLKIPLDFLKKEEGKKLSIEEFFEIIQERQRLRSKDNFLNVKKIQMIDIDLFDKTPIVTIKELMIENKRKGIVLKGLFENINPKILPIRGLPEIDELKIDLEHDGEEVKITNLNIRSDFDIVSVSGKINTINKKIHFNGLLNYQGSPFKHYSLLGEKGGFLKNIDGYTDLNLSFEGPLESPQVTGKLLGKKIKSKFANADELDLIFYFGNKVLGIDSFRVLDSSGAISFKKDATPIFDFNTDKILINEIEVNLNSLKTNSALYYLDFLNPLKGRISGGVKIKYFNETLSFECLKDVSLDNFRLTFPNAKNDILSIKKLNLRKCDFEIRNNKDFFLNVDFSFLNSRVKATGIIGSEGFNIKTFDTVLGLKELGPISGVQLFGNGPVDLWVRGEKSNVVLDFKAKFKDFSVLDFHFGDADSNFKYDISKSQLDIDNFESLNGRSKINGNGKLKFGDNPGIDLKIQSPYANLIDSRKIYKRILSDKIPIFKNLKIGYETNYVVSGGFSPSDLIINGSFLSKDIEVIKENMDELKFNFEFSNRNIYISDFVLKKNKGRLKTKGLYNLKNEYFEYSGDFTGLRLEDIKLYEVLNFGLTGMFEGEFRGHGRGNKFNSRTSMRLKHSKVDNLIIGNSNLTIFNNSNDWFLSGDLFGNIIRGKTYLNLDPSDQSKLSSININVDIDDMKTMAGVLSAHNIKNKTISGQAVGELNSSFSIFKPEKLNADITVSKFYFKNENRKINLSPSNNKVIIENGEIKLWNIILDGSGQSFSSFGEGNISSKFNIQNLLSLNANHIQLLSPDIKKANGRVEGKATLFGNIKKFSPSISLIGKDVNLNWSKIPGVFEGINFKLLANENEVILQELVAKYGGGEITGDGIVLYAIPFPNVDFNFKLTNTKLPLFKKSHLVLSGFGHLTGKSLPYNVSADFAVLHGQINDSFNEILKSKNDEGEYNKFLPKKNNSQKLQLFDLDVNSEIVNPIILKNNIAYLNFDGNLNIFGNYLNPLVKGDLKFLPEVSKFVFKGNEFLLSEGRINFLESTTKIEPELNFVGNAHVSEYDIKVNVSGKTENLGISLNSEPSLSQEDILSLLTIGITSDKSKKLQDSDRQSITSIGIGSLLIDQFQLNEGITSSLGLRLSVAPEFSEDGEEDLLAGRTGESNTSSTSRLKSTTRIKLKKKLTKKINISVSSTVGGTMEQKQEMNIDFNLKKNVSLEGVYEVKSSTDAESSETPNSVGADLKFQWSFK